jgi:hypothetical protein
MRIVGPVLREVRVYICRMRIVRNEMAIRIAIPFQFSLSAKGLNKSFGENSRM